MKNQELLKAAVCYLSVVMDPEHSTAQHDLWPFTHEEWKPSADPIVNLNKAVSLITAEIDLRQGRTNSNA